MFKLLTSTDNGGGIPVCIIRFVMFVPMGIYQAIATNHWNVIRNHPELHSGIYGTRWATGETFTRKWVSSNAMLYEAISIDFVFCPFGPMLSI